MFQSNNVFGLYHWYVRREAREILRQSRMINDGSINDKVFKKIRWYMVEMILMGEFLSNLSDRKISRKDKLSLMFLGAVMTLFDTVIDDFRADKNLVLRLFDNIMSPEKRIRSESEPAIEKLFYLYFDRLIASTEKGKWTAMYKHFHLIKFQMRSDEQLGESVSEEDVTRITRGKGGASLLLCSALILPPSEITNKAMFELGVLIQMMNDTQDIYKDTVQGIKTFVHFRKSFSGIIENLEKQRIITFNLLNSLSFSFRGRYETVFNFYAFYTVILYKLKRFSEASRNKLDFNIIASLGKESFRINPFSPRAISACYSRLLRFDYEGCQKENYFKDFIQG
jgi:hypothetical protein